MTEYIITVDETKTDYDGNVPISAKREIVRCRDCYFSDEIEGGYWCDRFTCGKELVTPNGYCKWGVRRDV